MGMPPTLSPLSRNPDNLTAHEFESQQQLGSITERNISKSIYGTNNSDRNKDENHCEVDLIITSIDKD